MVQVLPDCLTSFSRFKAARGLGEDFEESEYTDYMKQSINDASRQIREYVRRDLKYEVVTDEKHDGIFCKDVVLVDRWPLISLQDFYDDTGRDYGSDTQLTVADDEIEIAHAGSGAIRRIGSNFASGQKNLKIDYTGGFSEFYITPLNNKLDFNIGGSELTATLTSGLYNAGTLATELDTQIEAAASTSTEFTVTYDTTIHRFTLTKASDTFEIHWNTGANAISPTKPMHGLADLLGFAVGGNDTGALTYTSDEAVVAVPADLEGACLELSQWNYMRTRENWIGKSSEQRGDQSYSFDFAAIPSHISSRLNRYKHRKVG
jgi:hypothetical protein